MPGAAKDGPRGGGLKNSNGSLHRPGRGRFAPLSSQPGVFWGSGWGRGRLSSYFCERQGGAGWGGEHRAREQIAQQRPWGEQAGDPPRSPLCIFALV